MKNTSVFFITITICVLILSGCAVKESFVAEKDDGSQISKELKYATYMENQLAKALETKYEFEDIMVKIIPIEENKLSGIVIIKAKDTFDDTFFDDCTAVLSSSLSSYRVILNDEEVIKSDN